MPNASLPPVFKKPGHGIELYKPKLGLRNEGFPNAINHSGLYNGWGMIKPIALRELTMVRFMNVITDKPEWTRKVFDEAIVERWKAESIKDNDDVSEDEEVVPYELEMTHSMFDYSMQELRYRAEQFSTFPHGAVYALPGDVYKSDTAVSNELKLAIQAAVRPLEDVQESQKDWHPDSDGKVLDLVHPSLFPLVYGKSRILPVGSNAATLEDCTKRYVECEVLTEPEGNHSRPYSKKFQWLPCEVDISGERPKYTISIHGIAVRAYDSPSDRILTYINNLHPKHHPELYTIIEDIIGAAIPLWELTLATANKDALYDAPRRIQYTICEYHHPDEYPDDDDDYPEQGEDEDGYDYDERVDKWEKDREERRKVVLPEPAAEFDPKALEGKAFTMREKFEGKPLQVIVKLANIELTPEKPEYDGGSWHVEGMMNESICASAIYYYSSENITPSSLAFRQLGFDFDYEEVSYEQDHHDWLAQVYGLKQHGNTLQNIGNVDTREGRLITFPNLLQHQVQPFKLADRTKPGHRKILALFLVDPHTSIISTGDVPPQQHSWWAGETFGEMHEGPAAMSKMKDLLGTLPVELRDKVLVDMDDEFPITMQQAKEYREELMKERKSFEIAHDVSFKSVEISLCEH